jgi:hypothetical protein
VVLADPSLAAAFANAVIAAGRTDNWIKATSVIRPVGNRLLAKLGLAIGYKLLGAPFLTTDYARHSEKPFGKQAISRGVSAVRESSRWKT